MSTDHRPLILIVDDESDMLDMLRLVLKKRCGSDIVTAQSGREALEILKDERVPDVVLSDIKMPDMDGLTLLKKIREQDNSISVVIMTGYGTIDMAVEALKNGAYDFLQKPFENDELIRSMQKGLERTTLLRVNRSLEEQLRTYRLPEGFIGQSSALLAATERIARIADTDATVLIRGESGTGKEMAARALHELSSRSDRRIIIVNCPALPEQVLESELFGYSKGAFTGAVKGKKGLFLEADGSTIVLDEIADIPISIQTKLLRVLEEKEIQPLGQNKTIKVDVRVVASTNQDLEAKITAGEFREDLYYRLNVVTITMPSLREMKGDTPLLVQYFLENFKKRYKKPSLVLPRDLLQQLYHHNWQGNVRELRNTIKRIVLLSEDDAVCFSDLEAFAPDTGQKDIGEERWDIREYYTDTYNKAKASLLEVFTSGYLSRLLTEHKGNVTRAAAASGMERQALQRLMRKHHIVSTDYKKPPV
jgi:DNA-binding NtrC family response regulator